MFRNPHHREWETADAYLSGPVRTKLAAAEAAARLWTGQYAAQRRGSAGSAAEGHSALRISPRASAHPGCRPTISRPSPREVMGSARREIFHTAELATWAVDGSRFVGHRRRHLGMGHAPPPCRRSCCTTR